MSMSRIFFISFLLCVITVSCKEDALMSPIAIPDIVDTSMDISGTDIVLSGKVFLRRQNQKVWILFGRSEDEMEEFVSDFRLTKNSLSH